VRYETTIAIARGLVHRARHTEIERLLGDDILGASGRDGAMARTLLARARLLGGAGSSRARPVLRKASDGRAVDLDSGLDAASRAEIATWQGWIDAWPEVATFRPGSAIDAFRRAAALSRVAETPSASCWAYVGSALIYRVLRLPLLCLAVLDRAEESRWHASDHEADAWIAGLRLLTALQLGELDDAGDQMLRFSAAAGKLESPLYSARASILQARMSLEAENDAGRAVMLADAGTDLLFSSGWMRSQAFVEGCLLLHDAHIRLGNRADAMDQLERITDLAPTLVGMSERVRMRRERLESSALVHTMPRRRITTRPDSHGARDVSDVFWKTLPNLGLALAKHPLLITGERGTGKLHLARELHAVYAPAESRFVVIDCDATGVGLHDQAQLSDAISTTDDVTIVLRRIEMIGRPMADRLLALLAAADERSGGKHGKIIIATTSAPLAACVEEDRFPDDLFQRLSVAVAEVPALRRNPALVESLTWQFVNEFVAADQATPGVTDGALRALRSYDWPGNVRQLRNEIQRIVSSMAGEPAPIIDVMDLPEHLLDHSESDSRQVSGLDAALAATERDIIAAVLTRHGGQVASAAEELGLTRQGLYKKMKRLGVDTRRPHSDHEQSALSSN
jgi:hypothetical protein